MLFLEVAVVHANTWYWLACPCRFFSGFVPTNAQPYHIDCDDGFDWSGDELLFDEDSLVEEDFILDSK